MRPVPRQATELEARELWPAVRADRLFDTPDQFEQYCARAPWCIRVTDRGEAAVLGVWRAHLDVLAMRGVWCSSHRLSAFIDDACVQSGQRGLRRVLSPLLPIALLGPYRKANMSICQQITPIQGHPRGVLHADLPIGVRVRAGGPGDLARVASLDAQCFDEFWRYGLPELRDLFASERLTVAENDEGQLIGYTLATANGGAATLGRLGVAPAFRRSGLGRALVREVALWADDAGADTISLCTQAENVAARNLYAALGLTEVSEPYGFAIGNVDESRTRA